tara:strand:+ start:2846 stop:3079 length:234 start_codon:yes stop_codon:yes gene_type:complete
MYAMAVHSKQKKKFKIGDIVYVNDIYKIFGNTGDYLVIDIIESTPDYSLYKILSIQQLKNGILDTGEASGELLHHIT